MTLTREGVLLTCRPFLITNFFDESAMKPFFFANKFFLLGVVLLFAIIATVPVFLKHRRWSKSSEATVNIRAIFEGESIYFTKVLEGSIVLPKTQAPFQYIDWTPALPPTREARTGGFNLHKEWGAIFFRIKTPVYFSYAVTKGEEVDPGIDIQKYPHTFAVRAKGDLDGDGITSEFYRLGTLDENKRKVIPLGDLHISQEFE
jgi:hypothetical protein